MILMKRLAIAIVIVWLIASMIGCNSTNIEQNGIENGGSKQTVISSYKSSPVQSTAIIEKTPESCGIDQYHLVDRIDLDSDNRLLILDSNSLVTYDANKNNKQLYATGKTYPPSGVSISPNGEWITYTDSCSYNPLIYCLFTTSYSTKRQFTYVFDNSKWNLFLGWVNDQWLIFKKNSSPLSTVALFNPFTGEDRSYIPTYPQIRYTDYDYRWWGLITFYDPSLNLVAYIGNENGYEDHLFLFNKATQEILYMGPEISFMISSPLWSKSGKYLIYVKDTSNINLGQRKAELVQVQRDGTEKQLTNFSTGFKQYSIGDFSISNDENKVAFWFNGSKTVDGEMKGTVYILDLETGQLLDTCMSIYGSEQYFVGWSFDNRYIAITSGESSILVDIENREYAKLDGLNARGWIK
jgi:hypothetical protein